MCRSTIHFEISFHFKKTLFEKEKPLAKICKGLFFNVFLSYFFITLVLKTSSPVFTSAM